MKIPDHYEFFSQHKIISGKKSLEHIPIELGSFNAVKPLVIAKKGFDTKPFVKAFYESNCIIGGVYNEVTNYASIGMIKDIAELFKARGCDSIIALGTDAVVNVAKGVNMEVSLETENIMDLAGDNTIKKILKPLVSVPTAHTTGLEQTNIARIDNHSFKSDFLFPDIVIIDSRMVAGCCKGCVVDSAIIALTQAIESSDEPFDNPMNDAYAHPSIQYIYENLVKAAKKPKNNTTSMALANAAAIAGIAFSNSPAGIVYSTSSAIASITGNSKGKIMGMFLPIWLELKIEKNEKFRDELLLALVGFDTFSSTPLEKRRGLAIKLIKKMIKKTKSDIPDSLKKLRIYKYQYEEIAEKATPQGTKRFSTKDCIALLQAASGK